MFIKRPGREPPFHSSFQRNHSFRNTDSETSYLEGETAMRIKSALMGSFLLLSVAAPGFAQQGAGNGCTPAGVWYGGSVVAYKLTVVPQVPAGRYTVAFEGMYTNSVMRTTYSGEVEKKGDVFEGSLLALSTQNTDFVTLPPPYGEMPDLLAGWMSLRMVDCNNMTNTMPFFGLYFGAGTWLPGPIWAGKKPMVDAPNLDLLDILNAGHPVVESYRRLPNSVNPSLLHK